MKTVPFLFGVLGLLSASLLASEARAQEKTVTIFVWLDDGTDTAKPADKVALEATRSLRLPPGGQRYRQKLQGDSAVKNKYTVTLQNAPKSIDVGIDKAGYHSLALCDLAGTQDHSIHVRLFSLRTPIAAPECFALKTQYELLFRREQQYAPPPMAPRLDAPPDGAPPRRPRIAPARLDDEDARREASEAKRRHVQHVARLKYADGLLALPNPDRPRKTQSAATRAMLDRMQRDDPDGYDELDNMIEGLFDLYGMGGFEQYVPGKWKSQYWVGGNAVDADVEIHGTTGTYRTGPGDRNLHRLENLDFIEDHEEGGYLLTGNFRFKPGTPEEKTGSIRWKIDEQGFRETSSPGPSGRPSWSGTLQSGPYFPE